MRKFNSAQLYEIIRHIERMEMHDEDIWIPIGILEFMYDDDLGLLDKYFTTSKDKRILEDLVEQLIENADMA